ncbi:MAG: imidazolonepropionase [Planctomycetes bacterium]|nr:imidazolonepropionase [Planctomycetota bacterium]
MGTLTIINARVVTLASDGSEGGARRGAAMRELGVIEHGYVRMRDGAIAEVGAGHAAPKGGEVIDAGGRVCMPALVDCHTHLCHAGERWSEWDKIRAGASYESILAQGGGIMSTVAATRLALPDALEQDLSMRLRALAVLGVGTVEVKSGYGLEWSSEVRMLEAIGRAAGKAPQLVVATCLGGHAIPSDNPQWPAQFAGRIAELARLFPGIAVDAFCERNALSVEQCRAILAAAREHDLPRRLHTDQFNSMGGVAMALELGADTVDHLEAADATSIEAIARSSTIAVLLPCSAFALGGSYAAGRKLIDQGAAVALASNANPGSAPTVDLRFAMHLAARHCGLTAAEALTAATWNAACALRLQSTVGSLEPGKRGDAIVLEERDERALVHGFAGPPPRHVVLGGRLASPR